ncbi:MAG: hypothetical protein KDJ65_31285, partial [Anaerolineae bacterium]|nr:hypothetical protein [Anaerolineae bacterium]
MASVLALHRLVRIERHADAEEIAVAVDVVDAGDVGPELRLLEPGGRVGSLLAGVGVRPLRGGDDGGGVGRVFKRVVGWVKLADVDGVDFFANGDHRL